jgi:hypothetical protein
MRMDVPPDEPSEDMDRPRPMITDPEEFAIIKRIHFKRHDPRTDRNIDEDRIDRAMKRRNHNMNQSR